MIFLLFVLIILSFVLTGLYRSYALHKSIIDIPNHRSSHTISTPRGGGIALAIAWFLGLTWFVVNEKIERNLYFALLSGLPLTLSGFADDILNLSPRFRMMVQLFCAGLGLYFLGGLQSLTMGSFNIDFFVPLTVLAFISIIWSINLFNFLDGIDGYISTEIIFIGVSAFLLTGDQTGLLLASATLGFLIWNWEKARIFMGDVGSTLLGFTVAIMAIYHQNNQISTLPVWLIITSVFWMDATITLFRRIRNKEKLSQAHRKHAYQRIVQSGFSHQKTVMYALGINIINFGLAWLAIRYKEWNWLFMIADAILIYIIIRIVDRLKAFTND